MLINYESFRESIKVHHVAQQLASKQLAHWATWREDIEPASAAATITDASNPLANGTKMQVD